MALVDRRRQLDGRVQPRTRAHTYEDSYTLPSAGVIWPDSCELPGTLVSGLCKSGLSASEDTDHISEKRNVEAYRLCRGDGQPEKEGEQKKKKHLDWWLC